MSRTKCGTAFKLLLEDVYKAFGEGALRRPEGADVVARTQDSGEVKLFPSATNGENFPRWFVRLLVGAVLGWLLTLIVQIGAGAWWAATITEKLESLRGSMSQGVAANGTRIDSIRDDVKLLDLKVQSLEKNYAVLKDRQDRNGEKP